MFYFYVVFLHLPNSTICPYTHLILMMLDIDIKLALSLEYTPLYIDWYFQRVYNVANESFILIAKELYL